MIRILCASTASHRPSLWKGGSKMANNVDSRVNDDRLLVRVSEAARRLSISRSQAYLMVASGVLPHIRIGGRGVRIPVDLLEAWVMGQVREQNEGTDM